MATGLGWATDEPLKQRRHPQNDGVFIKINTQKLTTRARLLAFFAFALGRLGIKTALFKFNQETILLALFLEHAHGLLEAVLVCNLYFYHWKITDFLFYGSTRPAFAGLAHH